jgi:hypothetical protein
MKGSKYAIFGSYHIAMEFVAKIRAEVDRILFFGLGLKFNASRDVRKRFG